MLSCWKLIRLRSLYYDFSWLIEVERSLRPRTEPPILALLTVEDTPKLSNFDGFGDKIDGRIVDYCAIELLDSLRRRNFFFSIS